MFKRYGPAMAWAALAGFGIGFTGHQFAGWPALLFTLPVCLYGGYRTAADAHDAFKWRQHTRDWFNKGTFNGR